MPSMLTKVKSAVQLMCLRTQAFQQRESVLMLWSPKEERKLTTACREAVVYLLHHVCKVRAAVLGV